MPDPQIDIGQELAALDVASELSSLMASHETPPQADAMISKEDWDALPLAEKMNRFGKWALNSIGGTFLMQSPEETKAMGEHPGVTLAGAAVGPVLQKGPGLVARGLGISSVRAGQNIQAATQAAKDVPLNVERVGEAGLRAMDMQAAGATMPRAASRLMQRITDPALEPIQFGQARDFYSNLSRLSANEAGRMNPQMARQMSTMRAALHDALTEGAETVGKGQQYAKGIQEYARAARAAEAGKKVAKYGAGIAGAGVAGNYMLDKLLEALSGRPSR